LELYVQGADRQLGTPVAFPRHAGGRLDCPQTDVPPVVQLGYTGGSDHRAREGEPADGSPRNAQRSERVSHADSIVLDADRETRHPQSEKRRQQPGPAEPQQARP
jgi:hypothetical protein